MKKIFKLVLSLTILMSSFLSFKPTEVKAYGDFSYGARHIGEWNGHWISELYIDGQLAFCLDPSVLTPQSPADYPGYSEDWSGLSWDEQDRIGAIGNAFSKGLLSYLDAQIMIWEGRWYQGNLGATPNLQPNTFDIIVGNEARFTDTLGVIASKGYSVTNCSYGLECRIEGNDLIVKGVAKADTASATVGKSGGGASSWVAVWKKPGFQTIGVVYGSDPLYPATVNGRVRATEIEIYKRDEYGKVVPSPHTFEISNDPEFTNLIDTITTNANGYAKSKALDNGTYYVREKDTDWGYECNKQVFTVVANGNNVILDSLGSGATGGFINTSRNFKITITKKDVDNPEIILDGSYFEIYDTTDGIRELVKTIATGEKFTTGTYTFDEAKYRRTYEVCEVKAPNGFELDPSACKQVTMDILNGEEERKVEFENKKDVAEAEIELVKRDSQYDEMKINGAEFTVYDITQPSIKTELFKVVTGNQYLKLYNPYNPLEPLKNTEIDLYNEEAMITRLATVKTDLEGVINVTSLNLEKGKTYYYKIPGQVVTFESFDINSKLRVIPNTEVTFFSDKELKTEVIKLTSDNDGWINVGETAFNKSVAVKDVCIPSTLATATNTPTITPAGNSIKYYYKLKYVGKTIPLTVSNDITGKANVILQTNKKYEICETKAPDNYKINEEGKCRVVSLLKDDVAGNPTLKFEREKYLDDIYRLKLQVEKVDFENKRMLLNDAHFTFTDITWNGKDYKNILPWKDNYSLGEIVKFEELEFVVYNVSSYFVNVVNVNTRERFAIYKDKTVNLDRENKYVTRQLSGGFIVKDFRNEDEIKYNWDSLKVGDIVDGKSVKEVVSKKVYKLDDGSIVFKERLDKQPQENTKFIITNEKFEFVKDVFTGKDGFAVIASIPDGNYYAQNTITQETTKFQIEYGRINLEGLRKDSKYLVCEVQSPLGYLIGDVCEEIDISKAENEVMVKNIKPNRRKRMIRKMGDFNLFDFLGLKTPKN